MERLAVWEIGHGGFCGHIIVSVAPDCITDFVKPRGRTLAQIEDLYVHPLRRTYGWGARLMGQAVREADRQGWDMALRACPHGPKAVAGKPVPFKPLPKLLDFYRQFGFRLVNQKVQYETSYDVPAKAVMVRRSRA